MSERAARLLEIAAVVLATALASGLVLYHLGARQIWIDEGDTFATTSQHGLTLWHWALNDGGNMVAYYLGMHFFTEVFGTSEVALRLPSAIAAIGTVPVGYFLLRRLFDQRAAVFGALFLAGTLPFVWWGQTARGYLPAVFFVTAAALFLVLAVESRRRIHYVLWVAFSLFAVYTILLSSLVIAAQAVTLPFRRRHDLEWKRLLISAGAIGVLCVPAAAAAVIHGFAPVAWLPGPGTLFGTGNKYLVDVLASARITGTPVAGDVHYLLLSMIGAWALGALWFVLSIHRTGRSRESWGYLLLIAWMVLPFVASYIISAEVHPVLGDRYVLGLVPAASMLRGRRLLRLRPWPLAVAAGVALMVMRIWAAVPAIGVDLESWRNAVTVVAQRSQPRDCIAFFVSDGFTSFDYYALRLPPGEIGQLPRPVLPVTTYQSRAPYVLDPASISPPSWRSVVATCPRLWVVLTHPGPHDQPGPGALTYQKTEYGNRVALLGEVNADYRLIYDKPVLGVYLTLYAARPHVHPQPA